MPRKRSTKKKEQELWSPDDPPLELVTQNIIGTCRHCMQVVKAEAIMNKDREMVFFVMEPHNCLTFDRVQFATMFKPKTDIKFGTSATDDLKFFKLSKQSYDKLIRRMNELREEIKEIKYGLKGVEFETNEQLYFNGVVNYQYEMIQTICQELHESLSSNELAFLLYELGRQQTMERFKLAQTLDQRNRAIAEGRELKKKGSMKK